MQKVIEFIKNAELLNGVKRVGIAVSGGADSIALLNFFNEAKTQLDIEICAFHFDHKIRKTSTNDRLFVQNFCKENNIDFEYAEADVLGYCKNNKKGLEEGARELRYAFFETILKANKVDVIALAHHKNDQTETILLNILRGSGLEGVSGMKPKNAKFIRPFLVLSKGEILKYIQEKSLNFVNDETNFQNDYSRNFLRNEILPKLNERFGNVENALIRLSENAGIDNNFINSTIDFSCVKVNENSVSIPKNILLSYSKPQSFRLLKFALKKLNEEKDFSKTKFENISNLLNSQNGKKIELKKNLIAVLDYSFLTIEKRVENNKIQLEILTLKKSELNEFTFNRFTFKVLADLNACKEARHTLDYSKLPEELELRTRKEGDIFAKFGSGKKKLKDYFIAQKIIQRERDNILLLANKNQIICVLNHEISNDFKHDENTKQYLAIF